MKARVKATGEIIDVYESCTEDFPWTDEMGDKIWKTEELMFLETTDNTPDYWTRLEHQYAGMAMQGILGNQTYTKHLLDTSTSAKDARDIIVDASCYLAHALVQKLKKKEEK